MHWRSAMSDRKRVSCTVLLGLFAVLIFGAGLALSEQSSKPIRIGVLMTGFEPFYAGQGLAASLARPGTNVTGRSSQHFDLVPKMLQLFHEAVPKAGRIAVLVTAPNRLHQEAWAEAL